MYQVIANIEDSLTVAKSIINCNTNFTGSADSIVKLEQDCVATGDHHDKQQYSLSCSALTDPLTTISEVPSLEDIEEPLLEEAKVPLQKPMILPYESDNSSKDNSQDEELPKVG